MKCPRCVDDIDLVRTTYEDFTVRLCPKCHGFLLSPENLQGIERKQEMTHENLEQEASAVMDSHLAICCPRCNITMKRGVAPHALDFFIDFCKRCNFLWLDAGELEAIQLAYEQSPVGRDAMARREDMLNMSDERKEQLDRDISKAIDSRLNQEIADGFTDAFIYGGSCSHYRRYSMLGDIISSFFR